MADKVELKVGGLEQLDKLLRQLPERTERKVLQSAVTSSVREARKKIKAAAPVGQNPSSAQKKYGYGKLKKELRVLRLKRVRKNERAARIDTGNAFWAFFYELGTRKQSARPFFGNAFRSAEDAMIKKLAERLRAGIEREVRKFK